MGQPGEVEQFCRSRAPHVRCLADPSSVAYREYGLSRGSAAQLLGPASMMAGVRAATQGHLPSMPVGDPAMMPGTFAIDSGGVVRAAHYARYAGDQPDLAELLRALK